MAGTIGTALAFLHHSHGDQVWGCCRGEEHASRWVAAHHHLGTLLVCNASELSERHSDCGRLLCTMDRVYHLAAMKHVDLAESNPDEAAYQNVVITSLVASACDLADVPLVFASTDKACMAQGVYGATKLIAERMVVRQGGAAVRLGNVVGSTGSVFARWRESVARGQPVRLTDPDMTRYFIGVDEAARFMADGHKLGHVAIPHSMRAARMGDLADATRATVEVVGTRPGESRHQWLIAPGECASVEEGRILVGVGEERRKGYRSDDAPLWDAAELLELGGFWRCGP